MVQRSFVYIMGNEKPVLYVGVTSDLIRRVYLHKNNLVKGFTATYNVHKLLYYEIFEDITLAIQREKQLKRWHRDWKLNLIKSVNPSFRDLYHELLQ